MTSLLIATRNRHKVEEIRSILGGKFEYLSLEDFVGAPTPVENAPTFEGNARIKAVSLAAWLGTHPDKLFAGTKSDHFLHVLADDSGLEVDALHGEPGVHSARYASLETGAAGNAPDQANNSKLLQKLREVPPGQRAARFRCCLALTRLPFSRDSRKVLVTVPAMLAQSTRIFEGACEGHIAMAASGAKGFGYDPLFVPTGETKSFAELGDPVKNRLSHRARALQALKGAI